MTQAVIRAVILAGIAVVGLAGCETGTGPFAPKPAPGGEPLVDATVTAPTGAEAKPQTSTRFVDRDVEAPEVFQVTDQALWDGRPSLGGVWVASPDAKDPERVILRNPANGKFVIGALFRRERDNPGPKLQISSDAAAALGLLAGQPGKLNVTALRREEAAAPEPEKPILDSTESVQTATLDPIAAAGAAIDNADPASKTATKPTAPAAPVITSGGVAIPPSAAGSGVAPAAVVTTTTTAASAAKPASGSTRFQIGIFSVEENANRAAASLKKAGVSADVKAEETQGKKFWSVTASGTGDKAALLKKIKAQGFTDAYALR